MDFSYRLPFVRKWLTLYSDSLVHDDVSPPSAPRRAGIRPGIYLSHFPGLAPLDFRVEAASTDPPTSRSNGGQFLYTEDINIIKCRGRSLSYLSNSQFLPARRAASVDPVRALRTE